METEVDESQSPIQNGSTDFGSIEWMRLRTARLGGNWLCSGTVLDPRTVLTARHCVTSDGSFTGNIVAPETVTVRIDGGASRVAEFVFPMDTGNEIHDVALILLRAADAIRDASGNPIFTPMEPSAPASYLDDRILISGWGNDAGGDAGVLRHGGMIVDDDFLGTQGSRRDLIVLRTDPADQRGMPGDSGGPYWGDTRSTGTLPRGVIGVHSGDGSGSDTEVGTRVFNIRTWARSVISAHHGFSSGLGMNLSFSSSSHLDGTQRFSPDGDPASWTVTGGHLVQSLNVPLTPLIWPDRVVRDFNATAEINSPDNDGAGIIFHWSNPHYYYCEANDQENVLRIRSRINGTITTLASATWNGTFAANKTMTVVGRDSVYRCQFDGITISATSTRLPVGSMGLIQDSNAGVRFNSFSILGG